MSAWSDSPIPSAHQETAPPQQQPANTQHPTAADDRESEESPFFIKIVNAPKDESYVSENKHKSGDKPSFVWGMTAEEFTAVATFLLVIVGALTAAVLACQSLLLRRQVRATREEFIVTHRPKLIVRSVIPRGIPKESEVEGIVNKPFIKVYFEIANIGGSNATVIESAYEIEFSRPGTFTIPMPYPTEGKNQLGNILSIESGTHRVVDYPSTIYRWNEETLKIRTEFNLGIFLVGRIIYTDNMGLKRHTVFRRRFNGTFKFFEKVGNSDQEYAD